MPKLVNRIRPKIRCECYPCRNKADIALGPIEKKGLVFQICEGHARQIRDGLAELLGGVMAETEGEGPDGEREEPDEEATDGLDDWGGFGGGDGTLSEVEPEANGQTPAPRPVQKRGRPAKRSGRE
jgi:hypothetical protein